MKMPPRKSPQKKAQNGTNGKVAAPVVEVNIIVSHRNTVDNIKMFCVVFIDCT